MLVDDHHGIGNRFEDGAKARFALVSGTLARLHRAQVLDDREPTRLAHPHERGSHADTDRRPVSMQVTLVDRVIRNCAGQQAAKQGPISYDIVGMGDVVVVPAQELVAVVTDQFAKAAVGFDQSPFRGHPFDPEKRVVEERAIGIAAGLRLSSILLFFDHVISSCAKSIPCPPGWDIVGRQGIGS